MRYLLVVALLMGLFSLTVDAEVEGKAIAIITSGPVDSEIVDRVIRFARQNTALPIRLLPAQDIQADSLDAIGHALNGKKGADDVCLISIVWPEADIQPHGVLLPEEKVSVINAKSLKPEDGDAERYARRIEREVMQSMGLLLGLSACPNPQCALWFYSTDKELDMKGRNFCPPCLQKIQQNAVAAGMKLDENSPYVVR